MKNELNIELNGVKDTLIIREGKALELKEPKIIAIIGVLNSPLLWLEKRIKFIVEPKAHILVNRERMTIELKMDEESHYSATVTGGLEIHPIFRKFGINTGAYITHFEMADLFKMNRSYFENTDVAMKLVSELRNFRATVEKKIEQTDDKRGNRTDLLAQTVASNLPAAFNLNIPIFKGMDRYVLEVEVEIRATDLCCTLVSPQANDIVELIRDSAIDDVLDKIRAIAPDIAIIEQ
jgi:hypothetical protein